MKIIGHTDDGHRITQHHGGITHTETDPERDARLEEETYELVRAAGPELLQACVGLLAVIRQNFPSLKVEPPINGEQSLGADDVQAVDYALAIVRKLNPSYGVEQVPPVTGDNLA